MNEQDQQALFTLSHGDRITIYPRADRKYDVLFVRVDMDKQTVTVDGNFPYIDTSGTTEMIRYRNFKRSFSLTRKGWCFNPVGSSSICTSELITIDEQADDNVMH